MTVVPLNDRAHSLEELARLLAHEPEVGERVGRLALVVFVLKNHEFLVLAVEVVNKLEYPDMGVAAGRITLVVLEDGRLSELGEEECADLSGRHGLAGGIGSESQKVAAVARESSSAKTNGEDMTTDS